MSSTVWMKVRQAAFGWWGGIGFRVSFFMAMALVLAAALTGAFFLWEDKKAHDAEIRSDAFSEARELAAATMDGIRARNRQEISQKLSPRFTAHRKAFSGSVLLYVIAYDHTCNLLIGASGAQSFFDSASFRYTPPSGTGTLRQETALNCGSKQPPEPVFLTKKGGVSDLTLPVTAGNKHVGFIRVGISGQPYGQQYTRMLRKSGVAFLGILLVGMAFSRVITRGITRPILQLSEAIDKLSRQNWDAPLFVKGSDEISRLGHAFNQMALTLKQREASLSRGNRDLFILHTAGLDLMESIERDALLAKIAARAEDLVRAETTAISVIERSDPILRYLGVFGAKAKAIQEQELPFEAGGIYNWLASYATPLLIPDAQADFRLDSDLMRSLGVKSIISVPLWSSNTMTGVLTAVNKKGGASFDKHDLRLFTVFSSLAAAALQNAALYSDLKGKIDELKAAQEQLIHSTKMAAIGELSANVAHEINNPLTSVLGYTSHLLKTLQLQEAPRRILGLMEQETLRVRRIIRNLLDFARQKPSWMQPADIALPLRETLALVQGIADAASVTVRVGYPPAPLMVTMDHNEMKQVFINIVNNALHAMPRGGELRIRLDVVRDGEIVVEFSDTGIGIPPENIGKIFEPFFSTKEAGDGTGLGLSISYRIVRNHGGRIEAESEEGKGTVFRVILPLSQDTAPIQNLRQ